MTCQLSLSIEQSDYFYKKQINLLLFYFITYLLIIYFIFTKKEINLYQSRRMSYSDGKGVIQRVRKQLYE